MDIQRNQTASRCSLDAGGYYAATARPYPAFPALAGEVEADVAILGGGYTGVNAAIELRERGYSVALVEARHVGWGCSGRNGGQVIGGLAALSRLEKHLGPEAARVLWEAGTAGLDIVHGRIRRFGIDCDLKQGHFEAAWTRRQMAELLEEREAQLRLGYPHPLTAVEGLAMAEVLGTTAYVGGVLDGGCSHLHPLNLCIGEAQAAAAAGVRIFEHSPVVRVVPGARPALHTEGGRVTARHVIIAGNAYLDGVVPALRDRILPAGSYLVATEPLPEATARALIPADCAVSDANVLLDYYRLSGDSRLLFGGRCNYSGQRPRDIAGTLVPRMLKVFPSLEGVRIDYQWGGTVAVSLKRIPQLGRLPGNILYAQGYSGHGVVATHVAGRLLAEAVAGEAGAFDVLSRLAHRRIPGGRLATTAILFLAMSYFRLRDLL
jgi:gamma-glutamylputrescine oxidase